MTDKTTDRFGPDDIPESKILKIEEYMDNHAKEIVDFIERKISEKSKKDIKITGEIPNRIMNELVKEMPFGPGLDFCSYRIIQCPCKLILVRLAIESNG